MSRRPLITFLLLSAILVCQAQESGMPPMDDYPSGLVSRFVFELPDTLEASHAEVVIASVLLAGNRMTRNRIITRELPFSEGDTLSVHRFFRKVEAGRRNLLNTGIFNFVEASVDYSSFPSLTVSYHFVERWNIWPFPVLELDEPNLNQWLSNPSFRKFNYGIRFVGTNLTGRNERVSLNVKAGNVQSISLLVYNPYINKAQTIGWGIRYGLNRSHQRAYLTRNNQRQFLRINDQYIANEQYVATHVNIRPALYNNHRLALGIHLHSYADTLLLLNPRFGPGGRSSFSYASLSYSFRRDRRDIVAYPLEGYFLEAGLERKGLGLFGDTDMDVTLFDVNAQYYLPMAPRWYMASGIVARWSEGRTLSYFDQGGLGYLQSLVRGYEQFVVDGHKYLVLKYNLKYKLVPERVSNIGFIPSEKFSLIHYAIYVNLFLDGGMVKDRHFSAENPLTNRWLTGGGVGLDFVTYYDKVFRAEVTMNREGKPGLNFHLVAPI